MSPRARLIVAFLLTGLLASATGCADLTRKGHEFDEGVSDSWITTKLRNEQPVAGQVNANHGHVRTADGVVAASAAPQIYNDARATGESAEKPKSDLDMSQPMGHRSLPFFPVFAVRPW